MRKITLTLTLLSAACIQSFATNRTVSNDPNGGSQYSTLTAAYNASSNGDTILIEGTNTNYFATYTWAKSLVVIGIGTNPQKQNPRLSIIYQDYLYLNPGSKGTKFFGIYFTGRVQAFDSFITFENCRFWNNNNNNVFLHTYANDVTFRNCIFNNTHGSYGNIYFQNQVLRTMVTNCIFDKWIDGSSHSYLGLNVDHCVFLNSSISIYSLRNTTITNNIFMNSNTIESNGNTSFPNSYSNNISRLGGLPSGSDNLNNSDPKFVTYTNGQTYLTTHDYHLQSGSPAIGAASDNTDIGIHGGYSNFNESMEVLINPIMRLLKINNITIQPSGTLSIDVNATKPNDD